ncbi:MAG: hypothetical protein JNJ54_06075 [Myxococcaceae bacterium]|nr:hypothetical protein [Myxococcaceae bacterium]
MTNLVQGDAKKRSTVSGPVSGDPWPAIEAWAQANGYKVVAGAGSGTRTWQKGTGLLVAPMMLVTALEGTTLTVQGWVQPTFLARLFALFLIPAETNIGTDGFVMLIPRRMANKAVNGLLTQLGLPTIP